MATASLAVINMVVMAALLALSSTVVFVALQTTMTLTVSLMQTHSDNTMRQAVDAARDTKDRSILVATDTATTLGAGVMLATLEQYRQRVFDFFDPMDELLLHLKSMLVSEDTGVETQEEMERIFKRVAAYLLHPKSHWQREIHWALWMYTPWKKTKFINLAFLLKKFPQELVEQVSAAQPDAAAKYQAITQHDSFIAANDSGTFLADYRVTFDPNSGDVTFGEECSGNLLKSAFRSCPITFPTITDSQRGSFNTLQERIQAQDNDPIHASENVIGQIPDMSSFTATTFAYPPTANPTRLTIQIATSAMGPMIRQILQYRDIERYYMIMIEGDGQWNEDPPGWDITKRRQGLVIANTHAKVLHPVEGKRTFMSPAVRLLNTTEDGLVQKSMEVLLKTASTGFWDSVTDKTPCYFTFNQSKYFCQAHQFSWHAMKLAGILVRPEHLILGDILTVNSELKEELNSIENQLKEKQELSKAEVRSAKGRGTMLGIALSVAVLLLSVGVAAVLNWFISRPLRRVVGLLEKVSDMDVDDIETIKPSKIYEVATIGKSFQQMVTMLQQYRKFLPEALFFGDEPSNDSEAGQLDSARMSSPSPRSPIHAPSPAQRSHTHKTESSGSSRIQRNTNRFHLGLTTHRHATVMIVDLHPFDANLDGIGVEVVSRIVTDWMELIHKCTTETGGTVSPGHRDVMYCYWGAQKVVSSAWQQAITSALKIQNKFNELKVIWEEELSIIFDCLPRISVATGPILSGALGNVQRVFCVVGNPVTLASSFLSLNTPLGTTVLMDKETHGRVMYQTTSRMVDIVSPPSRIKDRKRTFVFEVLGVKEHQEDEWMYQLEANNATEEQNVYEIATNHMIKSQYAEAAQFFQQHVERHPQDQAAIRLLELCTERCETTNGDPFTTL